MIDESFSIKRKCNICGGIFPIEEFEKNKRMRLGRGNRCKACMNKRNKSRLFKLSKKWMENNPFELHPTGRKLCPRCMIDKSIRDFSVFNGSNDGLRRECKLCQVTAPKWIRVFDEDGINVGQVCRTDELGRIHWVAFDLTNRQIGKFSGSGARQKAISALIYGTIY